MYFFAKDTFAKKNKKRIYTLTISIIFILYYTIIIPTKNDRTINKINKKKSLNVFYASYKLIIIKRKLKNTDYRKYYRY